MPEKIMPQELYHEIFGSILDRREMTPYLLQNCDDYQDALNQASRMMANRGFDLSDGQLSDREKKRAIDYVHLSISYFTEWLFPFIRRQLLTLIRLGSAGEELYRECLKALQTTEETFYDDTFTRLITSDPRHLFLLASSGSNESLFKGQGEFPQDVPWLWQRVSCGTLKMCHLIKSIEEDSQDISDFTRLGFFLQSKGISLENLYQYNWNAAVDIPTEESARRAFVKVATFFMKINESIVHNDRDDSLLFVSGDGVTVPIVEIKARLKSPESMFTKLGKSIENEVFNIRDILAITFILKDRDDALTLFHALQKRGVILQEYTVSPSITQTLFRTPEEMHEAVSRLMIGLSRSSGENEIPDKKVIQENALHFFNGLNVARAANNHSSGGHRKFQCKINYTLPVHREWDSNCILVPGTTEYDQRDKKKLVTKQHTLPVELRISDVISWRESELHGDAHHDAYKSRQLLSVMSRLFAPLFPFEETDMRQLRDDQKKIFS
jgi:uncharacterized protein (TIGR04562 family)